MPTSLAKRLTLVMGVAGTRAVRKALSGVSRGISRLSSAVKTASKLLLALGLTLGAASVGAAAQFQDAMVKSTAIMGDLSEVMKKDLSNAARQVALTTKFSAKEAADSFFFLASAGLNAAQSIQALPVVAKFAQAGNFDMAQATDLLTDAQSALGLTIRDDVVKNMENMVRLSDVLVKANTLSNATVEQFSQSLTREAGAALKSFGISVEEGVAALAVFADQGVKGELAGTSLSRILRLMTSAAVKNAGAYEGFGISVFNTSGNIRNMADIIEDVTDVLGPMSDSTRVAALEQLGLRARVQGVILPLLGTSEAFRQYEDKLNKAKETTGEISDKQIKSLIGQFGLLKDAVKDIFIDFGLKELGGLTDLIQKMRKAILENRDAILGFAQGIENIVKSAASWVIENRKIILTFFGIVAVLGIISAAISLLTSPIVLIGLAVIGLIELWKRFGDTISDFVTKSFDKIKPFLNKVIQGWILLGKIEKLIFAGLIDSAKEAFKNLVDFAKPAMEKLSKAWKFLGKLVGKVSGKISDVWKDTVEKVKKKGDENATAQLGFLEKIAKATNETLNTDYVGIIAKGAKRGAKAFGDGIDKMKKKFLGLFKPSGASGGTVGIANKIVEDFKKSRTEVDKLAARGSVVDTTSALAKVRREQEALAKVQRPEILVPTFLDEFQKAIRLADSFTERLDILSMAFRETFGASGQAAFESIKAASKSAFDSMKEQSKAFFSGESSRLFSFKVLGKAVWAEVRASALDAIAGILKGRAEQWALEAGAALLKGNVAQAAGLFALATAAGGAAAIVSGAAAGVRQKAREEAAADLGQPKPLTPAEREAGVTTPRGRTVRGGRGVITQGQPQNITIAPATTFQVSNGGILALGPGGIEEAGEVLDDFIVRRIQDALRSGEI